MLKFRRIALGVAFIVYGLLTITRIVHADSPGSGGGYGVLAGPQNDGNGPNQPPPPPGPGSNVPYI